MANGGATGVMNQRVQGQNNGLQVMNKGSTAPRQLSPMKQLTGNDKQIGSSLFSDPHLGQVGQDVPPMPGGGIPNNVPLPPYSGNGNPQPNTAPTSGATTQGQRAPSIFRSSAQGINDAMAGARNEMMYNPMASNVTADRLSNANLSAYANPYQNQVIDNTLNDLNKARQMQMNQVGANASASGAFGGSRQALREAETNTGYFDQAARTAANLRLQGFRDVQNMAQADINNKLRADMSNQGSALAGSQQRLAANNQLANLSNLGFGMGQQLQGNLAQDGAMKQGLNQLLIDAVKNQFNQRSQAPYQSIGLLSQALGASPVPQTTTTTKTPGLFDYLTLAAS